MDCEDGLEIPKPVDFLKKKKKKKKEGEEERERKIGEISCNNRNSEKERGL